MRQSYRGIWVGLVLLFGAGPARANLLYTFATDQPVYNVVAGGTIKVQVFLDETGSPGDPFVLALSGDGMFSTGVRLLYPATAAAQVARGTDIKGNSAFDNGGGGGSIFTDVTSSSAGFTQFTFGPNVHGDPITGGYQLLLGTFTFTAGPSPGSFLVTVARFDANDQILTGIGVVLDALVSNATATINVSTVVPEPSSFLMAACGIVAGLGFWYRHRAA